MTYVKFDGEAAGNYINSYLEWGKDNGVDLINGVFLLSGRGVAIPCPDGETRIINKMFYKPVSPLTRPLEDYL